MSNLGAAREALSDLCQSDFGGMVKQMVKSLWVAGEEVGVRNSCFECGGAESAKWRQKL